MAINKNIKNVILIITLMTSALPVLLTAQERVINGLTITKNTVWRGTIRLRGDVVVKKNAKLIVESGTKVLFEANTDMTKSGKDKTKSEIIVEGIIDVQGDISNKVLFSSASKNPRMGDWYGITIINPSIASIIEYAVVEYAYNAISTKRSHPQIRKCQIRYNYNAGLLFEVKSNPKVIENIISENGYAGIICKLGSKPILTGNLIALNQVGVVIFSMSKPNFGNLAKGKNYNIGMNDIHDNQEYNIYNHSSEQIFAENNSWGVTSLTKIKQKIFDRRQNAKYGLVKIEPLLQTEQNKDKLMALAQTPAPSNTAKTTSQPATASPVPQTNNSSAGTPDKNTAIATGAASSGPTLSAANNKPSSSDTAVKENKISRKIAKMPPVVVPIKKKKKIKPQVPTIDYNQVFLEPFLDKKRRRIIKSVKPEVDGSKIVIKSSGRVIVRVIVDQKGNVESAQILKGLSELYDMASLDAAKKFKFEPGTVKGVPVRFSTNILFEYK